MHALVVDDVSDNDSLNQPWRLELAFAIAVGTFILASCWPRQFLLQ